MRRRNEYGDKKGSTFGSGTIKNGQSQRNRVDRYEQPRIYDNTIPVTCEE